MCKIAPRESIAPADRIAKTLVAGGPAAVAVPTGHGVLAVVGEGEWQAMAGSAAQHEAAALVQPELAAAGRRDALVADIVPGVALRWSWPDMLRHAVALAESLTPAGEAELRVYEKLLPRFG